SNSSFSPVESGSKKKAEKRKSENNGNGNNIYTVTFDKIHYNGGDDTTIPITIYYFDPDNTEKSISDYISITNIIPSSSIKEPDPIDESKIVPSLTIISSKTINA